MEDETMRAYFTGRLNGLAGKRDPDEAADPATGPDYRMGFLDGRLEVFRVLAAARKLTEEEEF
jgi:hypothetical protein